MLIWNRGEPPPQSSSVTLNFVASVVRLANVVTPVSVKLMPLASFVFVTSEKSERSFTWFPCIVAAPKSEPDAETADGTNTSVASAAQSVMNRVLSRFMWTGPSLHHLLRSLSLSLLDGLQDIKLPQRCTQVAL